MGVRGEVRDRERERYRDHIKPCRPCKEFLFSSDYHGESLKDFK